MNLYFSDRPICDGKINIKFVIPTIQTPGAITSPMKWTVRRGPPGMPLSPIRALFILKSNSPLSPRFAYNPQWGAFWELQLYRVEALNLLPKLLERWQL
ncbi:unnamed protein product [Macrosiphum euphorbiae]|uniref:Uncharacterized protein n=1 Tax=Macrosiphum euphorbiae TaxID=13131 RepID=A0AAV0Y7S2_9HEMI|nr:unnamed protein product [Macrosiphum euphorbiae]CAI6375978.1 unnamed protein product [Macrosiphum euphorbiae]CAI6375986.1 unnamed protein product [Macrosiphum euphorbiae]CAI6375998.1 unnamed protein product [Macrosiphum euphorbiae]CAI6376003.1 unnamed protein product [Macrosiphum euphorbiae]